MKVCKIFSNSHNRGNIVLITDITVNSYENASPYPAAEKRVLEHYDK